MTTPILGSATFTVTRGSGTTGGYENGYYVQGDSTEFDVDGSLQPAEARDLRLLPEGSRSEARWVLLCAGSSTALEVRDRIAAHSGTYLVMVVMDWTMHSPLPYRGYVLGEVTSV